jgi:hypothetical protein
LTGQLIGPRESVRQASNLVRLRRAHGKGQLRKAQRKHIKNMITQGPAEHPGRSVGKPAGSWIDELVCNQTAIVLCDLRCKSKFDHGAADYYMDRRFPYVSGKCDGCRETMIQCRLYIHNSFLSEPNGRIRSGQVWRPL